MKNLWIYIIITALIIISICACDQMQKSSEAQDENSIIQEQKVYEWRGENRSGKYSDTGLLKTWPEKGPELVWEYEGVGNGYGSPIFTKDRMYILGEIDSLAYLLAFDLDGKLLWKKDFGKEWVLNYNGSRSTPTIVDDLIYVTSGLGNVYCFNRNTGEKIWSVDMINDLNGAFPLFGYSESVIIEDDKVFCTPGGTDNISRPYRHRLGKNSRQHRGITRTCQIAIKQVREEGDRRQGFRRCLRSASAIIRECACRWRLYVRLRIRIRRWCSRS